MSGQLEPKSWLAGLVVGFMIGAMTAVSFVPQSWLFTK